MKHIYLSIILLLVPFALSAQSTDPFSGEVGYREGTLPNGITYSIVTNNNAKGSADFALVQKGPQRRRAIRHSLKALPHFSSKKPYLFLSSNGIGCSASGYAEVSDASVNYLFHDIPVWKESVADSVLLVIFDIMPTSEAEQGIVICGDVDADKLIQRMYTLSMFVPERIEARPPAFDTTSQKSIGYECTRGRNSRLGAVQATFLFSRVPDSLMQSSLPRINELFAGQLGEALSFRLHNSFKEADIPVAAIRSGYIDSSKPSPEQRFWVEVVTDKDVLPRAGALLARTLSQFSSGGCGRDEFAAAKGAFSRKCAIQARQGRPDNDELMERCIAHYLFDAPLQSRKQRAVVLGKSTLPADKERELFNKFSGALLQGGGRMILHFTSPEHINYRDSLLSAFSAGWEEGSKSNPAWKFKSDSSRLSVPAGSSVKIQSEAAESVTGGKIWTFKNGIKILYRRAETGDNFLYGFFIRGGGRLEYAEDAFNLYGAGALNASEFKLMLDAAGIERNVRVSPSGLRISGSASKKSLSLLLKSIIALSNTRKADDRDFEYFRQCELLRSGKDPGAGMKAEAEAYFSHQLSCFDDGIIIIVGDFDENALKAQLSRLAPMLRTSSVQTRRPRIDYTAPEGSISDKGEVYGLINYHLEAPVIYSARRNAAFRIALLELRRRLIAQLSPAGYRLEIKHRFEYFPAELAIVDINLRKCGNAGLPEGIEPQPCSKAIEIIRNTIASLDADSIGKRATCDKGGWNATNEDESGDGQLDIYKKRVGAQMAGECRSADFLLKAALERYDSGRNLLAGYGEAASSVDRELLQECFDCLKKGVANIEYCDE